MTQWRGPAHALMATLMVIGISACDSAEPLRPRAIVIAVDGASDRVINPMIEEGLMPNLAAIRRAGSSGPIRSHIPALSPRIWTSVATGRSPRTHGIKGWVWKDDEGKLQLFSSRNRSVHAIWNILSDHGFRVGVVNWLNTHPPEKINGVMISDFAFPVVEKRRGIAAEFGRAEFPDADGEVASPLDEATSYTFPREWMLRVRELRESSEHLTPVPDPFRNYHGELGEYLSNLYSDDTLSTRMALEIQREIDPDLLLVYLPGIDRASHFMWAGVEPMDAYPESERVTPEEHENMRTALRNLYRHVDALIGLLIADHADDDLVMILSDHGFEAGSGTAGKMPGVHESKATMDGVFFARGRGIPAGVRIRPGDLKVNDITPTLISWFGLDRAEDMEGIAAPFLDLPLSGVVATYDTTTIERLDEGNTGEVEDTIKNQLESLGYIEQE